MVLIAYGTRPEYIKIKPLIEEMGKQGIEYKTLFTGQHKDIVQGTADYTLQIKEDSNNRLDSIISGCMNLPDQWFEGITYVLVQGDTTSVLGLALAAFHRKIKIIHLEAGLRTGDMKNPYPEEANRRLVSSIANIHFCPTISNYYNLGYEGIKTNRYVVGNTGLDNLVKYKKDVKYENKILITLHRRENHDKMDKWFSAINTLAKKYSEYEFILPLHPNPNVQKHKHLLTHVKVVEPLTHEQLIELLVIVKLVISDSGGIQEECSFLRKKCLVCRKTTERPESSSDTSFLVKSPSELTWYFNHHIESYNNFILSESPFGDGNTSKKICSILKRKLKTR